MAKLIFKGDTLVECENGHPVLTITEEVSCGDEAGKFWLSLKFADGQQSPVAGDDIDKCLCHCGAKYIRPDLFGTIQLNINGLGWYP